MSVLAKVSSNLENWDLKYEFYTALMLRKEE
jgi:hypothetical protein